MSEERGLWIDNPSQGNTGHGHVWPRPDGLKARCGGPEICAQCARDLATLSRRAKQLLTGQEP